MDDKLARLNRIYPNSKYVIIPKYNPDTWKDREYDSAYDIKSPINNWKTKPLDYERAQEMVEQGFRIGWIVPKGLVVVDIDNKDDVNSQECIEKLLRKFEVKYSYNYTSKGIHILLQDPSNQIKSDSRSKCSLNIVVDTRANETGYIILPCNDPHREWGEWNDFVENIPYFLLPVTKDKTPSFIGMTEGDGRNNALFKWRSVLEKTGKLQPEEIEKSIRIINENVFATAMSNKELFKTVLKERDKEKTFNVLEKKNPYNEIAEDIIGKFDIISLGMNFYMFNGIYYKPVQDVEIEKLIHFEVSKSLGDSARREIIKFLRIKTQVPPEQFDKDWYKIACKNGILNLVTGEVTVPTKADINTIYIPYEYDDDPPYSPRIDQFMKDLANGDAIKIQFLYQIAGYCLLKKNLFSKFFIFKGEGGTGKSTFMDLIHKMVGGDTNCSHIGLADFDKDYYLATLLSKLVNIDDDVVDGKVLENTGRFKSVISGNIISVRQIYKEVVSFVPYVTCMFSCNRLPKIMDKTSGLFRRMVLISLDNKVKNPDPLFLQKVTTEDMRYFLFKSVQGIMKAIEQGKFMINESEEQLLNQFKRRQSPLHEWLYENDICLEDIVNKPCVSLYNQFIAWCELNGYKKTMTAFTFKEDISTLYDMSIDIIKNEKGSQHMIFVKYGDYDKKYKPF